MITLEEIKNDSVHKRMFISTDDGGQNPCWNVKKHNDSLNRETVYYDPELTALANCTAWAIGRFNMLIGFDYCHYLSATDADNFINIAKKQGLTVTQEPCVGGIMVWNDGKSGHVEVVEEMSADENICYDSSSGYGIYMLAKKTRKRNAGGTNQWGFKTPTEYLGCINPPKKAKTEPVQNKTEPTQSADQTVSDPNIYCEVGGKKYRFVLEEVKE